MPKRTHFRKGESPLVVKRYPNRKLYDTERSAYVTLDDLAEMIRKGRELQVIDNDTMEDITSNTLTQIIFEMEKKSKSLLPISTLQQIIRSGGSMTQFVQKSLRSGVHSLSQAKSEVERDLAEFSHRIDDKIKSTLGTMSGVTSYKRKFQDLQTKVRELEMRISQVTRSARDR